MGEQDFSVKISVIELPSKSTVVFTKCSNAHLLTVTCTPGAGPRLGHCVSQYIE